MMRIVSLNDRPDLHGSALALNAAHEIETGPLDSASFIALLEMSFAAPAAIDEGDRLLAFMLCLSEAVPYDSPNYSWVSARLRRFAYVDRVIVAPQARGRGVGRRIYEAVAAQAQEAGLAWLACEVNLDPPNPVSDAFHEALGFQPVGIAHQPARAKTMRYLVMPLGLPR
jgi:predicted GNAT superfamily acetyltransferase